MAKRVKTTQQKTGLYHAREARGMSRTELVRLSGVSKQQLSRLENGLIRLRLDHLKPFAPHLGYTPEQILLWGRYPGTDTDTIEQQKKAAQSAEGLRQVPELDISAERPTSTSRETRRAGRYTDPIKAERWGLPSTFVRDELRSSADGLVVLEMNGDSMAPTIMAGDRLIIDTEHTVPAPGGLYAIRDPSEGVIVKRLQLLRSAKPARVKVISDNTKYPIEEVVLSDLTILGKAVCSVKLL